MHGGDALWKGFKDPKDEKGPKVLRSRRYDALEK